MSNPTTASATTASTRITHGTRITDFAGLDLVVEGLAGGGVDLVVWGRNTARANQMQALKLLKPELLSATQLVRRSFIVRQFEDTALEWCHLWPHQAILSTYGLTRLPAFENLPVLELEYAPNGSIRDLLWRARAQHGHPPLRAALAWAVHIATALAYLHQPDPAHDRPVPLVHGNLKAENVLLDEHGWAKLTDFGFIRAYAALSDSAESAVRPNPAADSQAGGPALTPQQAEVARLRAVLAAAGALPPDQSDVTADTLFATHTLGISPTQAMRISAASASQAPADIGSRGPVAGTPPYMAPEQWLGLDAVVPATDLYAFGVLLYELFAGSESPHPFPIDPTPFLTPQLYAYAQASGYDPGLLAWHAAHTASSGPAHRLSDPDVAAAALTSGPLEELATGDGSNRRAVEAALHQLDALVTACLGPDPASRPSAATLQQQIAALAVKPCGLEPIQIPEPLPATPQNEAAFWGDIANTYTNLGRHEEAVTTQRRALQYAPDSLNWAVLGNTLSRIGDDERRQAAEAAAVGRSEEAAHRAAAAQQQMEEALAAYQQAEALATPQALVQHPSLTASLASNQGAVLGDLGRYTEAIAAYQRSLALRPDQPDTRFNLALGYARWSQAPDATPAERIERLRAAQNEIQAVLAAAPNMVDGRRLADRIARALADPSHSAPDLRAPSPTSGGGAYSTATDGGYGSGYSGGGYGGTSTDSPAGYGGTGGRGGGEGTPPHPPIPPASALPDDPEASKEQSNRPTPVDFTCYYPRDAKIGAWDILLVFVARDHPQASSTIASLAAERIEQRAAEFRNLTVPSQLPLQRGTLLTITPWLPGFRFDPLSITGEWLEDVHRYEFRMRAERAKPDQAVNGIVWILEGLALRGAIPISVFVRGASRSSDGRADDPSARFASAQATAYRNTFPSYAHKDTRIVRAFEAVAEATGDRFLRDVHALRAGQRWSDALLDLIDQADVFQLFWSRASAHSIEVEHEWRRALKILPTKTPEFIRPVCWTQHPPQLPDELKPTQYGYVEPEALGLGHPSWLSRLFG